MFYNLANNFISAIFALNGLATFREDKFILKKEIKVYFCNYSMKFRSKL